MRSSGRPLRRLLLGLALALQPVGGAAAKFADPIGAADIFGAWAVLAREGEDGRFGFCAAELAYENGLTFAVLLLEDARIELLLSHPEFALTAGQRFEIAVHLDETLSRTLSVRLETHAIEGVLEPDPPFLAALADARQIAFEIPGGDVELPVAESGLDEAVPALIACLGEHAGVAPDGRRASPERRLRARGT